MHDHLFNLIESIAQRARTASLALNVATERKRQNSWSYCSKSGIDRKTVENQKDLNAAEENKLSAAMVDRYGNHGRIGGMARASGNWLNYDP